MSIQLVTYANQTVTPTNDAIIYERAIDQNGIFYGCNVTVSSNEVHITGGYGIICGREFTIQSEAITVTLAPSGTLDGRLYVRLDLADADDPIQLLTATGNTLPPLEQDDDVNYTNGTYEMELATFTVGVSALSDCVETFETIVGSKPYTAYIVDTGTDNSWQYKKYSDGTFDAWISFDLNVACNTSTGSLYCTADQTISLPSFTNTSIADWSISGSVNGLEAVWFLSFGASPPSAGYRLIRTNSRTAQARHVTMLLSGKWT